MAQGKTDESLVPVSLAPAGCENYPLQPAGPAPYMDEVLIYTFGRSMLTLQPHIEQSPGR